jgi:hypothetical protein
MDDSFPVTEVREMKLRYLIIDKNNQLRFIHRQEVEAVFRGDAHVAELGCGHLSELRLVSVVYGPRLLPQRIYLMRMMLTNGYFTRRNYRTLRSFTLREHVTLREAFQHHSEGWPCDFFVQLAIALDVTRGMLDVPFGVGGPLMIAAALKISPNSALRYLQ